MNKVDNLAAKQSDIILKKLLETWLTETQLQWESFVAVCKNKCYANLREVALRN